MADSGLIVGTVEECMDSLGEQGLSQMWPRSVKVVSC